MYTYKVAWIDHCGERHESVVQANTISEAELTVWEQNEECLGMISSFQVD